jgi:ABC-2 type transport system ATP-binding protein
MLTTHYLEEAEQLCDRIAIIDHGRIVAHDTTAALLRSVDAKTLIVTPARPVEDLPPALEARGVELSGGTLVLRYRPSETRIGEVIAAIEGAGVAVADVSTVETDLQDVFLQLTGSAAARAA